MRRGSEMAASGSMREPVTQRRERSDVEGVFPLMPQQYYDLIARRKTADGEHRLMFAVLEDAIRSYLICMNKKSTARRKEFEEVDGWINQRGDLSVFSFDNLCALLQVDPDQLRRQLRLINASMLPRRRLGTIGRRVPMNASRATD